MENLFNLFQRAGFFLIGVLLIMTLILGSGASLVIAFVKLFKNDNPIK